MPVPEPFLPIALDIAPINFVSGSPVSLVDPSSAMFIFVDQPGGPSSSQVQHAAHIFNIRERIQFDSHTSSDHQTTLQIEVENVKRNCAAIKELIKSISHEQDVVKSFFEFFKYRLTNDVLHISENVSRMSVEISTFKYHFIKMKSDVFLD